MAGLENGINHARWWSEAVCREERLRARRAADRGSLHLLARREEQYPGPPPLPGERPLPRPGRQLGVADHGCIYPGLHDLHRQGQPLPQPLPKRALLCQRAAASTVSRSPPSVLAASASAPQLSQRGGGVSRASSVLQRAALQDFLSWPGGGFNGSCSMDVESAVTTMAPSMVAPSVSQLQGTEFGNWSQ